MREKLKKLREILTELRSVAIAYSGGVDSTLLLSVAREVLGDKVVAVTSRSETYPPHELEEAKSLARCLGVRHIIIHTEELSIERFSDNPPDRCYYCKRELFEKLWEVARREGLEAVCDGANADDVGDWRPGLIAGKELSVRSPLKEAGLTKDEIRALSKQRGLPTWDKPAYACLSSRFPYGEKITPEKVRMVARAEELLRSLGFRQYRVRHHGSVARIELLPEDIPRALEERTREKISQGLKQLGFTYVAIDLDGYRSGSMNEALGLRGDELRLT